MELKNKVYVPITDSDRIVEMMKWCEDNLQYNTWSWSYVSDSDLNSDVSFCFVKDEDATFFMLKWL